MYIRQSSTKADDCAYAGTFAAIKKNEKQNQHIRE